MINLRQIDKKFVLSGGFTDIDKDIDYLIALGVVAILDVGMTPDDDYNGMGKFITEKCAEEDIEYEYIPMRDDELNSDLFGIWEHAGSILFEWTEKYPQRRQLILIKCATGISRSVSCLIYYLCVANRWSFVEALNYVRENEEFKTQFGASPHPYFYNQLKGLFPDYD